MRKVFQTENSYLMFCDDTEYKLIEREGVNNSFLFCAKYPYHKQIVGYTGNCPKEHDEYLYAVRDHVMSLNMVDAEHPKFFSDAMIYAGLDFIEIELAKGRNVVVVCNKGESRSPTMCLMYMMAHGSFDKSFTHTQVFSKFKKIAPEWNPGNGILQYCISFWNKVKGECK